MVTAVKHGGGRTRTVPYVCSLVTFLLIAGVSCEQASDLEGPGQAYLHVRPRWSPDGATVVFRGDLGGRRGIILVDTSGMNVRLILEGEGIGFTWSPDSRWICFSAYGSLFRIRVDGDSLTRLTTGARDIRPAWSPDGDGIAFVRTGIWISRLSTGQASQLAPEGDYPGWAPGGSEVVFLLAFPGVDPLDPRNLYEIDAVDTLSRVMREVWVVRSSSDVTFPTLSPAGDAFAFTVRSSGLPQIWKSSLTDSTLNRLTDDGGDYASWSPDGRMLVYSRVAEDDGGLWMMQTDGSGKRRLTRP